MNKEDVVILAQLLSSMKDAANEIESTLKKKDIARLNVLKNEILSLKEQVDRKL